MADEVNSSTLHLVGSRRADTISGMRRAVMEMARDRIARRLLDDVALVISELLTNALEHGGPSSELVADVSETDGRFVVAVSNRIGDVRPPPISEWSMAARNEVRGRGLAIVRQLAPEVSIGEHDEMITVSAAWPSID